VSESEKGGKRRGIGGGEIVRVHIMMMKMIFPSE
jgi:hypothetical protein